jgi:hypothetical protein
MYKYVLHVSLHRWRFSRSSCSRQTRSTLLCAARRLPSADALLNVRPASRPNQMTKGRGPACLTATRSSSSNNPVHRVAPCHRCRLMFVVFLGAAHELRHGRKTASPHIMPWSARLLRLDSGGTAGEIQCAQPGPIAFQHQQQGHIASPFTWHCACSDLVSNSRIHLNYLAMKSFRCASVPRRNGYTHGAGAMHLATGHTINN